VTLSKALRAALQRGPGIREQLRRLMKKDLWKGAFRTLGAKYINDQIWFAYNQSKNMSFLQKMAHLGGVKMNNPVANARATEQSILRR
jgi:hypothetical protein